MDLATEKMTISSLRAEVDRLTKDRDKILKWVKDKQNECDIFEEQAKKTSEGLSARKRELDAKILEFRTEEEKIRSERNELKKEKEHLQAVLFEHNKSITDAKGILATVEVKRAELEKIDLEVSEKLKWWNSVKEQLARIR